MKCYILLGLLILALATACGGSGSGESGGDDENGGDDNSNDTSTTAKLYNYLSGSEITGGASGIASDTAFTITFQSALKEVPNDRLFFVEGHPSTNTSTTYDATVCGQASAIDTHVSDCTAEMTSCNFEPQNFLKQGTAYSLCVPTNIKYADDNTFEGATFAFTTAAAAVTDGACTDPNIPDIVVITALPFDISRSKYITKFRGCVTHTYNDILEPTPYSEQRHGIEALDPTCDLANLTPVYAPFDARVSYVYRDPEEPDCDSSTHPDGVFMVQSADHLRFAMFFLDSNMVDGLEIGSLVSAGDLIAYTQGGIEFDFRTIFQDSCNATNTCERRFCEIGAFLSDSVKADLESHGVDAGDLFFTKSYREANNCTLGDYDNGDYRLTAPAGEVDWVNFE